MKRSTLRVASAAFVVLFAWPSQASKASQPVLLAFDREEVSSKQKFESYCEHALPAQTQRLASLQSQIEAAAKFISNGRIAIPGGQVASLVQTGAAAISMVRRKIAGLETQLKEEQLLLNQIQSLCKLQQDVFERVEKDKISMASPQAAPEAAPAAPAAPAVPLNPTALRLSAAPPAALAMPAAVPPAVDQAELQWQVVGLVNQAASPVPMDQQLAEYARNKAEAKQLEAKAIEEKKQNEQVTNYLSKQGLFLRQRKKELEDDIDKEEKELSDVRKRLNYSGDIKNIMTEVEKFRELVHEEKANVTHDEKMLQEEKLNISKEEEKLALERQEIEKKRNYTKQAKQEVENEARKFLEDKAKEQKELKAEKDELEKEKKSIAPLLTSKRAAEEAYAEEKAKVAQMKADVEEQSKTLWEQKSVQLAELQTLHNQKQDMQKQIASQKQEMEKQLQVMDKLKESVMKNTTALKAEAEKAIADKQKVDADMAATSINLADTQKKVEEMTEQLQGKVKEEAEMETHLAEKRREASTEELRLVNQQQLSELKKHRRPVAVALHAAQQQAHRSSQAVLRGAATIASKRKAHHHWISLLESDAMTKRSMGGPAADPAKFDFKQVQTWCMQIGKLHDDDMDIVKKDTETLNAEKAEVAEKVDNEAKLKEQLSMQLNFEKEAREDVAELQGLVDKAQHTATVVAQLLQFNKDAPSADVIVANKELLDASQAILKSRKTVLQARSAITQYQAATLKKAEDEAVSIQENTTRTQGKLDATMEHLRRMRAVCVEMGFMTE